MGLRDLNDDLYKRQATKPRVVRPSGFDPNAEQHTESDEAFRAGTENWKKEPVSFGVKYRPELIKGAIIAGIMCMVALAYVVFIKIQQSAFNSDRVTVSVDGPSEVSGTDASLFVIAYINANRSALTDVNMDISYPDNFRPEQMENMTINGSSSRIRIGTIAGNTRGKIEVRGKFHGSKGTLAYIKGVLRYQPVSVGSFFTAESQLGITIQSPSIQLVIDAPLETASGNVAEYRLDYTNMSDTAFDRLRLKVEYPEGFLLQQSDPKASEGDAIWYIGNVLPGQSGSVKIVGTLNGVKNEAKVIQAHIGLLQGNGELLSYSDSDRTTRIVASPLSVRQTVNGLDHATIAPGGTMNIAVQYQNEGEVGLRNVIVTLELSGEALDFSQLQLNDGGAFDAARKTVTWKASDVRDLANLAPQKGGKVSVTVPVLETILTRPGADKNFSVTGVARIDSPDIPTPTGANKIIGSDTLRVKIASRIGVVVRGAYVDPVIANTGPFPSELDKETTYTLHWSVSNTLNDVEKTIVSSYLPTGLRWVGAISPSSESLSYNERTNQIVWNIGNVPSGTGVTSSPREVAFQVALKPQVNQVIPSIILMDQIDMTAHDTFTDEDLHTNTVPYRLSSVEQ